MLMEVDEDDKEWAEAIHEDEVSDQSAHSTAMGALVRLAEDIGEKSTLACAQPIIAECLNSTEWVKRFAGYELYSVIAETCKDSLKKNL